MVPKQYPTNKGQLLFQLVFYITILFIQISCSSNNEKNKITKTNKEGIYRAPISILVTNPVLIKTDTCPKPRIVLLPINPNSSPPSLNKKDIKANKGLSPEINSFTVLKNKNGEIIKDKKGNPFVLGEAGGTSSFTNYTTDNGLAIDAIDCSKIDKMGNLWFGTAGGGASRYDGKSFVNYTTSQGLANNVVRNIMEDNAGNLWFGTAGGGVSCYDGKSFMNLTASQGLANNTVTSICEDKKGNFWFGTNAGLSRYDGKSFINLTTLQGLASNQLKSIYEDKTGKG